MFLLLFVVAAIPFVVVMILFSRMARLQRENDDNKLAIETLKDRILLLEQLGRPDRPPPPPPFSVVLPVPKAIPVPEPEPISVAAPAEATYQPVAADAADTTMDDWETRIGGNWLNKLGVLIVVVGIALFVAYSFTQMGPPGRVAIGFGAGAVMIAAGWWLERREQTRMFGRGLTAGGWAAIYFTAYAMHAIEAARIVDNPIAGFVLLIAAATGLVLYSLRYGSETVTGVAYFAAFAALLLAPRTAITLPASLPLAGSLLFVAWQWRWTRLALAGTAFTYLAFAMAAPPKEMWVVLACYWLMFEAFDLTLLRREKASLCAINGLGLAACSFLIWGPAIPGFDVYMATMSAGFLASGVLRAFLKPRGENLEDTFAGGYHLAVAFAALFAGGAIVTRFSGEALILMLLLEAEMLVLSGRFVNSARLRQIGVPVLAIALFALAIKFPGFNHPQEARWLGAALLAAVALYANRILIPGWLLSGYTAAAVVAAMLAVCLPNQWVGPAFIVWAGASLVASWLTQSFPDFRRHAWVLGAAGTAIAIALDTFDFDKARGGAWERGAALFLSAVLMYGATARERGTAGQWALRAGALLACFGLIPVVPQEWLGLAWLVLAVAHALLAGDHTLTVPCRQVAAVAGASGVLWLLAGSGSLWLPLSLGAGILLAYGFRDDEPAAAMSTGAGALMLMVAFQRMLTAGVTLAWGAEGMALLLAGFAFTSRAMRLTGLGVFALCILRLFFYDFSTLETGARILSFVLLGLLLLGGSWLYTRFREDIQRYL
ncbi:MAG: DUF2339 domain-containing protein [Bryobacteraceae bacterium]